MNQKVKSLLRDIFCDDDVANADGSVTPGQANPIKTLVVPPYIVLNIITCVKAAMDSHFAQNAPYYFGALSAGAALLASAIYIHSKASK